MIVMRQQCDACRFETGAKAAFPFADRAGLLTAADQRDALTAALDQIIRDATRALEVVARHLIGPITLQRAVDETTGACAEATSRTNVDS